MRSWLMVGLLVAVGLAGCSDGGEAPVDEGTFDDVPIEVTETTGAIRGVVVDTAIVPVADVTVRIESTGEETATDDGGRFVFTNLNAGTYFLAVEKPGYKAVQTNAEVIAGLAEPPVLKIQVERLFDAEPYVVGLKQAGYFQCSQAGLLIGIYSSSNCVTDYTKRFTGPPGLAPQLDNVTNQQREWHADVPEGWQNLVLEMDWEPSAQGTSPNMGVVLSTYKPEREGSHWFANHGSAAPLRVELQTGVIHESAGALEPKMIPEEGMQDMSYFVSVRQDNWPVPAVAFEQEFEVYIHQFIYAPSPADWSFLNGDPLPF